MAISYEGLVSKELVKHTKLSLGKSTNEKLTYYIDNNIGINYLDTYISYSNNWSIVPENISFISEGSSNQDQEYIRYVFNNIDEIIDLDFEEMSTNNGSNIDIYSITESSLFDENVVGQAIKQSAKEGSWWEILWKDLDSKLNTSSIEKHTIIHEIGHVLGLSHPFEDPFNEKWTSEDTVMSYNEGVNGWNTWFSNSDIKALKSIWGRENDYGFINIDGPSNNYKFHKSDENEYMIKTDTGFENISMLEEIYFSDKVFDVKKDIKEVFDQINSKDCITGQTYRLYNAAFGRFPDSEGLKYWINKYDSGIDTFRDISQSFIISEEFKLIYGNNISNDKFVDKMYENILNREPDNEGFNYWTNQLNNGHENRSEVLIGFSESNENKDIFTLETGIS